MSKPSESMPPGHNRPRFSIGALFYLTACLCISFTVGVGGVGPLVADWSAVLLTLATLGVATELIGQAATVRDTPGYATARFVRYAAVGAMAACLVVRIAERCGWLVQGERDEAIFLLFWEQPFPDAVWYALLVAAAGTLCRRTPEPHGALAWRPLIGTIALVALSGIYIAVLVSELAFIHYLVHVATSGIEAAEPLAWQRDDVFPPHVREGFFTYRTVSAAACLTTFGAVLVALFTHARRPVWRWSLGLAIASTCATLAAFSWWYFRVELPRVSPDMAAGGWAFTTWDVFGGSALLLATAGWLACHLTREGAGEAGAEYQAHRPFGTLPVWLAAVGLAAGGGVPATWLAIDTFSDLSLYFSATPSGRALEALRGLLLSPWCLMLVALAVAGLQVAWSAWCDRMPRISRLPLGRTAANFAMMALLGLVGVPTLAAYSFGFWLGPWWQ